MGLPDPVWWCRFRGAGLMVRMLRNFVTRYFSNEEALIIVLLLAVSFLLIGFLVNKRGSEDKQEHRVHQVN